MTVSRKKNFLDTKKGGKIVLMIWGLWVIVDNLQHTLLAQPTCFYPTCEGDSKMDHIKENKSGFR